MNSIRPFFFLFLFIISPFVSRSQSVYGTVSTPSALLADFYALPFNDSVLFSYTEYTRAGEFTHKTKWMKEDGKVTDIILNIRPVAIAGNEEGIYYYYFVEDNKSLKLKAIVEDVHSHERKESSSSLLFPKGIVLAAYQDLNMFFIIFDREANIITLLEVRDLDVVSEKHYNVPPLISKLLRKPSHVEFFNGSHSPINSFKGGSKVKLYRYTDLYLVIDSRSSDEKGTHVFRFPQNGREVELFLFPIETSDDFVSFLVDNKLFRSVISPKKFILTVHDLSSEKPMGTTELVKSEQQLERFFRHARAKTVSKTQLSVKSLMKAAGVGDPSLTVFKDYDKYVILWGIHVDDNGMIGPAGLNGLNPVAGFLTMVVGTAILQMMEGPGISQHFYYQYDEKDVSFKLPEESSSYVRTKLDEYEIGKQAQKVKVKYKNYIPYKNGIIAIYYEHKRKTATLVNFQ